MTSGAQGLSIGPRVSGPRQAQTSFSTRRAAHLGAGWRDGPRTDPGRPSPPRTRSRRSSPVHRIARIHLPRQDPTRPSHQFSLGCWREGTIRFAALLRARSWGRAPSRAPPLPPVRSQRTLDRPERGAQMAEEVVLVCDECGNPGATTITIRAGERNYAKDLCATHLRALLKDTRRRDAAGGGRSLPIPEPEQCGNVPRRGSAPQPSVRPAGRLPRRTDGRTAQRVRDFRSYGSTPSRISGGADPVTLAG